MTLLRPAGRSTSAGPGASSFSLSWDDGTEGAEVVARRRGPPVPVTKENYAAALREQIVARDALRSDPGPFGSRVGGYGSIARNGAAILGMSGGDLGPRAPSPRSQAGYYVAGDGVSGLGAGAGRNGTPSGAQGQNAYALELRAQIEERAAQKAEKRRAQLLADREDEVRVEREAAEFRQQVSREREMQANRHRLLNARADALERYLGAQGKTPVRGAVSADGGDFVPSRRPPLQPGARLEQMQQEERYQEQFVQPQMRQRSCEPRRSCGALPGQEDPVPSGVSANRYASGSHQNNGNVITDRPTSKVVNPPGGRSSFSLGW